MTVLPRLRVAFTAAVVGFAALSALPAGAQPAPQAKPAEAAPSPAHVAVARDVVIASGVSRTFDGMVRQTMEQYATNILQTRKDLQADFATAMNEVEAKARSTEIANMQIAAAILLAKRMNEDELKQVLAFFKTPAGAKYIEMQPAFLDGLVVAIDGWSQRVLPQVVDDLRAAMNKKGHNL